MFGQEAILVIALSSALSAAGAIGYLGWRSRSPVPAADRRQDVVFLFDGRSLADATAAARQMLPPATGGLDDWGRFLLGFGDRFTNLEERLSRLDPGESASLVNPDDPEGGLSLQVRRHGALLRIALVDDRADARSELLERFGLMALQAELSTLRSIAEDSPILTWKQREDGTVIWANAAYIDRARRESRDAAMFGWPPPDLFAAHAGGPALPPGRPRRVALESRHSDKPHWFELRRHDTGDGILSFAQPIDELVRAESALSDFVQTLTKTFAHLTVGLAIFDHKRRLVLFNPALVDLTSLPAEQLSMQPSLHSFLDALRERQRIPEPKDYKSWRLEIARLEAGAADGTYAQNWHLPNGQTYRVTGRPHPDGAVAYLFEDISSEISMTRSFRSEIETSRAVLDCIDDAVAVFSPNGILTLSNRAYADLWSTDHGAQPVETSFAEAVRVWSGQCRDPEEVAERMSGLLSRAEMRRTWCGLLSLKDRRVVQCRVRPLTGGSTLISFRDGDAAAHNLDNPPLSRVGT